MAVKVGEVPPLPPHISFAEARSLLAAILKGDPNRGEIIRESWKQMFAG